MEDIKIGIITSSDRASSGIYKDVSGPAIEEYFKNRLVNHISFEYILIPDEQSEIENALIKLSDEHQCCLICTTGGTGPALRDVTPEATESVCEKMLPGFGESMRFESLKFVPTAILSRQTAGIRGKCLIINLPGKPKAIAECLDAVIDAIPYSIDLIEGPYLEFREVFGPAFRPGKKKK